MRALASALFVVALAAVGSPAHAATPACWGPAAIDPAMPCSNPALDSTVVPSVADALLQPGSPCVPWRAARPEICTFGARGAQIRRRIALIGDSHSSHWRAALDVVARRHRWQGLSIYRTGCAFNLSGTHRLTGANELACTVHNDEVERWMAHRTDIAFVVVSEHDPFFSDRQPTAVRVQGYLDAWAGLPPSVRRIFVVRDPPHFPDEVSSCVERVAQEGGIPGIACNQLRSQVEQLDTAVLAAQAPNVDPRVRVVDPEEYFCAGDFCPPVIGGVLVHKDNGHMTQTYSRLLGPYLDLKMFPPPP